MSSYLITHLPPNTDSSKLVEFLIRNDFVFTFGQSAEELSSWVRAKNLIYNEFQKASKPPTPSLSYEEEIKPTDIAIKPQKPVFEVPLHRPRVPFLFRTANPVQKRTEPIFQRPVYKVLVAKPREVAPTVNVKDAARFKVQQQERQEEKPPVEEKKPPVVEEKDLTYLTGKHATLLMKEDEEDEEMIEDIDEQGPQEDPSCSTEDRSSPTTYKCHLINCGMEFSRQSLLVEHMELHPGEQPFRCNVCGKQYSQSGSLNRHMRLHTGEHPYECNYCEKKFTHPEQLKCHLRTHTGEKPYECEICKRRFTQSHSLKEHLRLHTGEKPYDCSYCKRKFNHQGTLQKHLRVHTGEKPYECYVCLKKFKHSAYLKQHLWVIHATVPNK